MKSITFYSVTTAALLLAAALATTLAPASVAGQGTTNVTDALDIVRTVYRADRQTFITDNLPLTEKEAAAFWPLYKEYRADMEKLGDEVLKLVLEYADAYPNLPEDRARKLLKDYTALEGKLTDTRNSYLKKAGKALPAAKVLRWAQLENRMDLGWRLQMAGAVPLVPPTQPNR